MFLFSENILRDVIRIDVRGHEVDGHILFHTMLNETIDPSSLRGGRSPHPEARADLLEGSCRDVIKSVIGFLLRLPSPKIEVGFVPNLEVPIGHILYAISLYEVLGEPKNQLIPLMRIARWRHIWVVPELVRSRPLGQFLRHETQFDKRIHPNLSHAIVDQVNAGEIQQQIARWILTPIDSHLVLKNSVKPDVPDVHNFSQRPQVVTPIFAERHRGMAGAEHMLPEMRKQLAGTLSVDDGLFFHSGLAELDELWAFGHHRHA